MLSRAVCDLFRPTLVPALVTPLLLIAFLLPLWFSKSATHFSEQRASFHFFWLEVSRAMPS
jgi:hypothetical protein